jgi:hypothetical protein
LGFWGFRDIIWGALFALKPQPHVHTKKLTYVTKKKKPKKTQEVVAKELSARASVLETSFAGRFCLRTCGVSTGQDWERGREEKAERTREMFKDIIGVRIRETRHI